MMEAEVKSYKIIQGDNIASMREMPDNSVDSIVTDPPYGLAFMNKKWDYDVPGIETWRECLRVLKPGGHLLAFGGARTYHRLVIPIEDAGFEIRDQMMWLFGSGFPKSHNVSKAIDKMHGAEREVVGVQELTGTARTLRGGNFNNPDAAIGAAIHNITTPATEDAQKWEGWGTALKPAHEPIVMARKPFKSTVAANVLEHGTGALNIDGCRIGSGEGRASGGIRKGSMATNFAMKAQDRPTGSRWPANILHDGSEAVLGIFPQTKVGGGVRRPKDWSTDVYGMEGKADPDSSFEASTGSAARYFYCAKASKRDRGEGNSHPTVKPTELMRYLVRIVTPPNGTVLDPFCGSGSTGKAAVLEGFGFIGIEREPEYARLAEARCEWAAAQVGLTPKAPLEGLHAPAAKIEPEKPAWPQQSLFDD